MSSQRGEGSNDATLSTVVMDIFRDSTTMFAWLKTIAPFFAVGSTVTIGAMALGKAPRVGPLRAIVLALQSKIRRPPPPFTDRASDLIDLKGQMQVRCRAPSLMDA